MILETYNYHMHSSDIFTCHTLIDITNTGVIRDSADAHMHKLRNQQRNWETFLQVLSLRSQPVIIEYPRLLKGVPLDQYGFSEGKGNVWTFRFTSEHTDSYTVEILEQDIHQVPILTGLDETVVFTVGVIDTRSSTKNTYFYRG